MLTGLIGIKGTQERGKLLSADLALVRRKRQHLVPRRLDRARLVDRHVARRGRNDPLGRMQHSGDDHKVCLRSAAKENYVRLGAGKGGADARLRRLGTSIRAVPTKGVPLHGCQAF